MNEEINDNKIFEFDHKDYIKKLRKGIIPVIVILPIIMILGFFFDFKGIFFQFIEDNTKILILIIFYIFARKMVAKKISLEIYFDSFILINDKIYEIIPFSKINEIKVYKNNKDELVLFVIKTGKMDYQIFSLKEMERLLEWFEKNKIINVNWNLSFHKKGLLDIKHCVFIGVWLSLILFLKTLELDFNLFFGIVCIFIGLISFIIQNKKISYLNDPISIYRWIWIVLGLIFILFTIFIN